jgi:hypothetical protein
MEIRPEQIVSVGGYPDSFGTGVVTSGCGQAENEQAISTVTETMDIVHVDSKIHLESWDQGNIPGSPPSQNSIDCAATLLQLSFLAGVSGDEKCNTAQLEIVVASDESGQQSMTSIPLCLPHCTSNLDLSSVYQNSASDGNYGHQDEIEANQQTQEHESTPQTPPHVLDNEMFDSIDKSHNLAIHRNAIELCEEVSIENPMTRQASYRLEIENMVNNRKRMLEKQAERSAQIRHSQWQQKKLTIQECIDESLREYKEMHEIATALRIRFENEAKGFEQKLKNMVRYEMDLREQATKRPKLSSCDGLTGWTKPMVHPAKGYQANSKAGSDSYWSDSWSNNKENESTSINKPSGYAGGGYYGGRYDKLAPQHSTFNDYYATYPNPVRTERTFLTERDDDIEMPRFEYQEELASPQRSIVTTDAVAKTLLENPTVPSVQDVYNKPLKKFTMPKTK